MDGDETTETDLPDQGPYRRQGDGSVPAWLTVEAPVAISLFSLLLSVYTIVVSNREPDIWLSAPDVVRVAAGERA